MRWLAVCLLFVGCSPAKRLANIVDKHPEVLQTLLQDSTIYDTLHISSVKLDTQLITNTIDTIKLINGTDSIYLFRSYDTIRIIRSTVRQEIIRPIQVKEKIKVLKVAAPLDWTKIIRWICLAVIAICGAVFGGKIISKLNISSWIK